jgi:hypothetical protein
LFDFENEERVKAMPAAALAMAKDPAGAKAKAAKALAFVHERQKAMIGAVKTAIG